MFFKKLIEIVRLSTKPLTIIYPIPFLQLLVFSQSNKSLISLITSLAFSFTFYPAVNLWNHINDIKEDMLAGRKSILIYDENVRRLTIIIVIFLYSISFIILVVSSKSKIISIILFSLCFLITWMYSDRIFLGRFIKRFKDHYLTELISFIIFYPTFTVLIWIFFDDLFSIKALALATTILFFILFGTLLKDIKDATSDRLAGLKTLGAVYTPEKLLKSSFFPLVMYYVSIIVFTILGVYRLETLLSTMPVILMIISFYKLRKVNWIISLRTKNSLKILVYSNTASLTLFIISGFLSQA